MVSVREIWRGALLRVLPASAGLVAALMFVPLITHPTDFHLAGLGVLAIELLGIAGGYGVVLTVLRRRLAADAGVAGRRAVVVGLCAPLGLLAASMVVQGIGFGRIGAISVSVGAAITAALFAPWLTRQDAAAPPALAAEALAELPEGVPGTERLQGKSRVVQVQPDAP